MSYVGPAPASSVIGTTDIGDNVITSPKLATTFFTGATDIGANIADADLFLMDDGAGGTIRKSAASRIKTYAGTDLTDIADGSASAPSIANSGDTNTGVYFPAADTVGVVTGGTEQFRFGSNPIPGGGKNLVQNGAMTVNQRGSVAVAADNTGTVDRYLARLIGSGAGRFTVTQDTTVPSGEGFGYSLKVDITTDDSSISGSEYYGIAHTIEAQNLQQLNFNNAASESLTLTFWARAKKAGLHGGAVYNNDANRSLVFSWTAVSDEWQKVTVPVPAETSAGTINNDTGAGLSIFWGLGAGAYLASDTDAWVAGAFLQVTSAVNDLDSTSNDFYLTGVQLEIGSVATSFAHEDFGTTLQKCQRYYERISYDSVADEIVTVSYLYSTSVNQGIAYYLEKRATPTITLTAGGTFKGRSGSSGFTAGTSNATGNVGKRSCLFQLTASSAPWTVGQGGDIRRDGTDVAYIEISAEL
jgi:hypothetical protein